MVGVREQADDLGAVLEADRAAFLLGQLRRLPRCARPDLKRLATVELHRIHAEPLGPRGVPRRGDLGVAASLGNRRSSLLRLLLYVLGNQVRWLRLRLADLLERFL